MADEISQVISLECKGVYYVIKGTSEAISLMMKMIKAIADWGKDRYLKKGGEISWEKLQAVSEGNPVIFEFPKEMFEEDASGKTIFEKYCDDHNLRYCTMPDLNPDDDYIPIAVPAQDAALHSEEIKSFMKKRIENEEAKEKEYDEQIEEVKKIKPENEEMSDEKQRQMESLEEGKAQNHEKLVQDREKLDKENILEFEEYLMQAKGTEFEDNPDKAAMIAETTGAVRKFMPNDCMYPIRDDGLVPDEGVIYYGQLEGEKDLKVIERRFNREENGLIYSDYIVINADKPYESKVFSDRGCSKEEWAKQMPLLFESAGMNMKEPTIPIYGAKRLAEYREVISRNFTSASSIGAEYSSKETEEYVEGVKRDNIQRRHYEHSQFSTVKVPTDTVLSDESQNVCLAMKDGVIKDVDILAIDQEEAYIRIKAENEYTFEDTKGNTAIVKGKEILEKISENVKETAKQVAKAVATRGAQ